MASVPGVTSPPWPAPSRSAGLVGYRYLLALLLLVTLSSGPMLVAVVAGAATLNDVPAPAGDANPFVSYHHDHPGDREP